MLTSVSSYDNIYVERGDYKMQMDRIYTIDELVIQLKSSRKTVINLINDDKLKAFKVGRAWRVTQVALNEFMEG